MVIDPYPMLVAIASPELFAVLDIKWNFQQRNLLVNLLEASHFGGRYPCHCWEHHILVGKTPVIAEE